MLQFSSDAGPGSWAWAQGQLAEAEGAHCGVETKVSKPRSIGEAVGSSPSRGAHQVEAGPRPQLPLAARAGGSSASEPRCHLPK